MDDAKKPPPQPGTCRNPACEHSSPSYTLRVSCCVFFIFLTEMCLAHYVYRLINAEIREEYLSRGDAERSVLEVFKSASGRAELSRLIAELGAWRKGGETGDGHARRTERNLTLRRKRSFAEDENVLNMASDGPTNDFQLRSELESKGDMDRLTLVKKGIAPGDVWLTTHNKMAVCQS